MKGRRIGVATVNAWAALSITLCMLATMSCSRVNARREGVKAGWQDWSAFRIPVYDGWIAKGGEEFSATTTKSSTHSFRLRMVERFATSGKTGDQSELKEWMSRRLGVTQKEVVMVGAMQDRIPVARVATKGTNSGKPRKWIGMFVYDGSRFLCVIQWRESNPEEIKLTEQLFAMLRYLSPRPKTSEEKHA